MTMYRVFSFSMLYNSSTGRQITEPDALDMIRHERRYRSFILTNSWGEYRGLADALQAVRQVPRSHYCHMVVGSTDRYIEFLYEGVIIYEDDRPFLVFGDWKGGN